MEYREFVCAAIETMNQKEGKNGIQAREHRAVKNNGKIRVGLLLQETGSNLFPTIYLEEYYEKFQNSVKWKKKWQLWQQNFWADRWNSKKML